jgi:hypothetical protein
VQRHHDVHGTHARGKMARIGRQVVNDETAQLVAHLRQLVDSQLLQVGRTVDGGKQRKMVFDIFVIGHSKRN